MTIAVVDDEKNVRQALKVALEREKFNVVSYSNGKEALDAINQNGSSDNIIPNLYILDIMMPVMDGLTFFRKLKELYPSMPAMFLTSRDEEFDKVLGLELGADDYLCKPFSMRELIARIHVLLRRLESSKATEPSSTSSASIISDGDLSLNPTSYIAYCNKSPLDLTVTEFRLLEGFLRHINDVLTREQLIEIAYPDDTYLNDRAIDCHIKRLRKKIGNNRIETVYGLGYRFPKAE